MSLRITEIWFKRSENAEWELGVDIAEGTGPLIDMNGKIVPAPIWNTREAYGNVMVVQERPKPHEKETAKQL